MAELRYQAEYAKSGRAGCKGCKQKIDQGALRIAVMVQSAFHDGKQPNWHHEECFFRKQRPLSANDIGNFNKLRSADQKRIKEAIEDDSIITNQQQTAPKPAPIVLFSVEDVNELTKLILPITDNSTLCIKGSK